MIDWTIVCGVIGILFTGTALFYRYVPPRDVPIDVFELRATIKGLEVALQAVKTNSEVWKERGDKYAAHNTSLQEDLMSIHKAIADILRAPERLAAYKDILEKMAANAIK